jgi:IclR family transcriptional regulator, acetate operon repressor
MSTALERGLALLERLAGQPEGVPLAVLADELEIPRSACHRLLAELQRCGYVRQARAQGDYLMTTKVVSLGLSYLSGTGLVDIAQPLLEGLAETSGELVRLALVDGDRLTWVAKAQGMRKGLRYDPDMGMDARLSCTASGHAWLLTLSDERALELVSQQGFGAPKDYGPRAPTTVKALLGHLHAARTRGVAIIDEVFAPGMAAMAAPVRRRNGEAIGVISIAGPRLRLTMARMNALTQPLVDTAAELGATSGASRLFGRPPLGKA